MEYSYSLDYVQDLEYKIKQKQEELTLLKMNVTNDIIHNTKIRIIESEIFELGIQKQYHLNYITDLMMRSCIGGCCKNKE